MEDTLIIKSHYFNQELFEPLYQLLKNITFPLRDAKRNNSRHGFPKHRCLTFGIVKRRFKGIITNSVSNAKYPNVYNELLNLATQLNPDFKFNSIHINHNLVCPKHKDRKNIGNSMIVSIGDYTGCKLVVNDEICDTHYSPVIFNGSLLEHYNTNDLVGNKYSIVYYNSLGNNRIIEKDLL